jgi:hypothetical protein
VAPKLRGCFHIACYAVYCAKNCAAKRVDPAKSNSRFINDDYLSRPAPWKQTLKTRNRLAREIDHETHSDRFRLPRFPGIGFVGRGALTRQRPRTPSGFGFPTINSKNSQR